MTIPTRFQRSRARFAHLQALVPQQRLSGPQRRALLGLIRSQRAVLKLRRRAAAARQPG